MVRLHWTRLYDIRIDGTLSQETDTFLFAGFLFEYANEFGTDNLALLLWIGYPCQLVKETVSRIYINKVGIQLIAEYTNHLFGFTLTQQTVIYMN